MEGSFVFIDQWDSGIHFSLGRNILRDNITKQTFLVRKIQHFSLTELNI